MSFVLSKLRLRLSGGCVDAALRIRSGPYHRHRSSSLGRTITTAITTTGSSTNSVHDGGNHDFHAKTATKNNDCCNKDNNNDTMNHVRNNASTKMATQRSTRLATSGFLWSRCLPPPSTTTTTTITSRFLTTTTTLPHDHDHDHHCQDHDCQDPRHHHHHHTHYQDDDQDDDLTPEDMRETFQAWFNPTTTTSATASNRDDAKQGESSNQNDSTTQHSSKSPEPSFLYQRLIDTARLSVEMVYQQHDGESMVGALAEAGGQDHAAQDWLLGWVALVQDYLPSWWWNSSDDKDILDNPHTQALLQLANNRNDQYLIQKCIDTKELKQKWGDENYLLAEWIVDETLRQVQLFNQQQQQQQQQPTSSSSTNKDDGPVEELALFRSQVLHQAMKIWGPETMQELLRKTPEEREMENDNDNGMVQMTPMMEQEDHWWGPDATHENPEPAYQRLIDAARRGTLLAHEQRGDFIGALADAIQGTNDHFDGGLGMDDYNIEHDNDNDDMLWTSSDDEDEYDSHDDQEQPTIPDPGEYMEAEFKEKTKDKDPSLGEESKAEPDNSGNTSSDKQSAVEEVDGDDDKNDNDDSNDVTYNPSEVGPEAVAHLEKFLVALKDTNSLPPWWNDEHEARMWELARNKDGNHFLAYPMDKDELKQQYPKPGAYRAVAWLAEAASSDMDANPDDDGDDENAMNGMPDFTIHEGDLFDKNHDKGAFDKGGDFSEK